MKQRRKQKGIRRILCSVFFMMLVFMTSMESHAYTSDNVPGVQFTEDGQAWTVVETLPENTMHFTEGASYWLETGTTVETGIPLNIQQLEEGQHYYKHLREPGMVAVYKWEVIHKGSKCIHTGVSDWFHGLTWDGRICGRPYWSGWAPYCADCGEQICGFMHYLSKETAQSIQYINTAKDYYYRCNNIINDNEICGHLEQAVSYEHKCNAVSYNRYAVEYDENVANTRGWMDMSFHMYNNETMLDGNPVVPNTRLNKNVYTRDGYVFTGWNTKPDGSGTGYGDEEEIFNLTTEHYDENSSEDTGEGVVTLYAQWEVSTSTLNIDADGGVYEDPAGVRSGDVTTLAGVPFGTAYELDEDKLTPPLGYKVSFVSSRGKYCAPIQPQKLFKSWQSVGTLKGRFVSPKYLFIAPNGNEDTLQAVYQQPAIILPDPSEGAEVGNLACIGWYREPSFTTYVGLPGDLFTPDGNVTLYAKWGEGLVLSSVTDLSVNGYQGGVDLDWTALETVGRTFKVFQKKAGEPEGSYRQVTNTGDMGDILQVKESFGYTETVGSYTIPYSGFYMFTGYGAQGAGYGTNAGGRGGKVAAKMYFDAGDIIYYKVGGQNGYGEGGTGTAPYGNGGGRTIVSYGKTATGETGIILIAGGGGAASEIGVGGAGGESVNLTGDSSGNGGSGLVGGGGGCIGGQAGEYIVHEHTEDCYRAFTWTAGYDWYYNSKSVVHGDGYNKWYNWDLPITTTWNDFNGTLIGAGCHSNDASWPVSNNTNIITAPIDVTNKGTVSFQLTDGSDGDSYTNPNIYRSTLYIKNGDTNEVLEKRVLINEAEPSTIMSYTENVTRKSVCGRENCHMMYHYDWVYSENDGGLCVNGTRSYRSRASFEHDGVWGGIGDYDEMVLKVSYVIPEGVDSIILEYETEYYALGKDGKTGSRCGAAISQVKHQSDLVICGYEEGQIISSKGAYGGSSYSNPNAVYVSEQAGVREGNGYFTIVSNDVGYMVDMKLHDVNAPDQAAPNSINGSNVLVEPDGTGIVKITWERPDDNGTTYNHIVRSYVTNTGNLAISSNEVTNEVKQGVYQYLVLYNTNSGTILNSTTPGVSKISSVAMKVSTRVNVPASGTQYLHIAPVDRAGNVGVTLHVPVDMVDMPVQWGILTDQIYISSTVGGRNYGSVYVNAAGVTYVKADGVTPFNLTFGSKVNGYATQEYQVDTLKFKIIDGSGSEQMFTTEAAHTSSSNAGIVYIPTGSLGRSTEGTRFFKDAMNSSVYRRNCAVDTVIGQAFSIPSVMSGKTFSVIPRAGASYTAADGWVDIQMSDEMVDVTHKISVVADGEGPAIQGMDIFDTLTEYDRDAGTVVVISAADTLSGVRSIEVEITNQDNLMSKVYTPGADGKVHIEINNSTTLFYGDIHVKAIAVDNVGNKTVVEKGSVNLQLVTGVRKAVPDGLVTYAAGEGAILDITTSGYAERVKIIWPAEFDPSLPTEISYISNPEFAKVEAIPFVVQAGKDIYTITVQAVKNGRVISKDVTIQVYGEKRGYVRIR